MSIWTVVCRQFPWITLPTSNHDVSNGAFLPVFTRKMRGFKCFRTGSELNAVGRDDFNLSPGLSPKNWSSENNLKALPADKACSECGSMKVDKAFPDMCVNGAAFLSLQKRSFDHEKWEVETSGEFLTLGPSCSSMQMIRSAHRGTGKCSICPVSRKPGEHASSWPSQQVLFEQAKGAHFSALSRAASNDDMMGLVEYKPNYLHTPLQRKAELSDFFVWSKMEGYSNHLQGSSTDESLDLELRLSI